MDLTHLFPDRKAGGQKSQETLKLSPETFLSLLHEAVRDGDTSRYFYLVEQGADPLLRIACDTSQDELDFLSECGYWAYRPDLGLLHAALRKGMGQVVRGLLGRGENPNGSNDEPGEPLRVWMMSRTTEHYEMERDRWIACGLALLEHGADPYLDGKTYQTRDGTTVALPCAIEMAERYEISEAAGLMRSFVEQQQLDTTAPAVRVGTRRRF